MSEDFWNDHREKWNTATPHKVTFEFNNEEDFQEFLGYMSDGGGEYSFMERQSEVHGRSIHFLYHDPDTRKFADEHGIVKVISYEET